MRVSACKTSRRPRRRRAAGRHEPRETRIITLTARMYAIVRNVAVAAGESEFGENLAHGDGATRESGLTPSPFRREGGTALLRREEFF